MSYRIKEIFPTIQGEGFHAGRAAVFVRFAGCNMWSGDEAHRERDAIRNSAKCPRWCDTDFVGGETMTAREICDAVAGYRNYELIVLTGGEPSLQVDMALVQALRNLAPWRDIAMETNGTKRPPPYLWVTLSPKQSREKCALHESDEIKIVVPSYDPNEWRDFPTRHRFVQAADGVPGSVDAAVSFVQANPAWRLSVQTHKVVGIR